MDPQQTSRIRPNTPDSGLRPSPNGGTPGDRSDGVYGEKQVHGMSPASAAERAPQQFTSTSNASGRTRITASARSETSCAARRVNTATDSFSAARGLVAFQSSCWISSIRGSIASAVKPSHCPVSTPVESVRTWTVWPRRDSSDNNALIGHRWPSAGEVYASIVAIR